MAQELDTETIAATEGVTEIVETTFKDAAGVPISGAELSSLTLTYYQEFTGEIINSRNAQDVLQAHGVTVSDQGKLKWIQEAADVAILNDALAFEPHIALFMFGYTGEDGNPATGKKAIRILVANLSKVP